MALDQQVNAIAITELPLYSNQVIDLIVIGGGPSGFMAAITAAEQGLLSVLVLEASSKPLEKVRISGGGRCNVTHACSDPRELVTHYPRGRLPLLGPFHRFSANDAVAWFAERGVDLVKEEDGRMFPKANSSDVVVSALRNTAHQAGVKLITKELVEKLEIQDQNRFLVQTKSGLSVVAKNVLLATGGHPIGRRIAMNLGHTIIQPVPSLFTLSLGSVLLKSCAGVALDNIEVSLLTSNKIFKERGRVLITHWGMSGPAILKLTAFAARELHFDNYKSKLLVNWIGMDIFAAKKILNEYRINKARKTIGATQPFNQLPKRLWLTLLQESSIKQSLRWADFSKVFEKNLIKNLTSSRYAIKNKGPYGEEFVTAGGVNLSEVDFVTMQSRLHQGLYFSGEILDIDGVTGGFNFQHCWTSGRLVGLAISNKKSL